MNSPLDRQSSVPRLQVELFQAIIAHINDRASLYALTLTSHFFKHETEPFLYACPMSLYPSPTLPPPCPPLNFQATYNDDPSTHLSFLRTIISTPRLALLVRAYHSPSVLRYSDSPLWRYTAKALCMMHGLKELHLRTFDAQRGARSLLLGTDHPLHQDHDPGYWMYRFSNTGIPNARTDSVDTFVCGEAGPEASAHDIGKAAHGPLFQLHMFYWGSHWDYDCPFAHLFPRISSHEPH